MSITYSCLIHFNVNSSFGQCGRKGNTTHPATYDNDREFLRIRGRGGAGHRQEFYQ